MAETGVQMTETSTGNKPKYIRIKGAAESTYWYENKIGFIYRITNENPRGKYDGWIGVDHPESMYNHYVRNGDYERICGKCGGVV